MANITRIKNNQITDSTITYQKIANGTLVGTNFNANLTLNSNVTILGNLTVANNYVQLNSINTYINDPVVVFNNNYNGSLTGYDIGMLVNRNLSSLGSYGSVNTFWGWVEADQAFEALATTDTGTGVSTINNSGYANVKVGNVTANSLTVSTGGISVVAGTIVAPAGVQGTPIGNVTTSTGAFTNLTASGPVTFTNSTASTSTGTGALVVTGGVGVGGNLNVYGNITTATGNIITTSSGIFYGAIGTGMNAIYAGLSTGYSILPNVVAQFSSNVNYYSQINHQNLNNGAYASSDFVATAGNGNDSGYFVDLGIASNTYSYPGYGAIRPNDSYLLANGGNLLLTTGNVGKSIVIASGGSDLANIVATFNAPGTTSSSSTTGALVLTGGVGISGALNVGGTLNSGVATFTSIQNTPIGSTTASTGAFTTVTTGGLQAQAIGNTAPGTAAFTTLTASGATTLTSTTESTTTSTGALVVSGGIGVAKNLNVGGNVVITGNLTVNGDVTTVNTATLDVEDLNITVAKGAASAAAANGAGLTVDAANATILYTSATDSWNLNKQLIGTGASFSNSTASTNTTTGALVVTGGVGIGGALYTGSTASHAGNVAITSGGGLTTTQTTGYLFNEAATTLNIGAAATAMNFGATSGTVTINNPTIVGSQTTQALWNTTATTINAFGAATTINAGNSSGVTNWAGIFKNSGNLVVTSGTDVTSTTTGALILTGSGGLNVGGNAYVANNLYIGSGAISQTFANPAMIAVDSGSNYAQIALKNTSSTGSADFAAYGDNGTDAGGWIDLGFTSSSFNDGNYTVTKPNDGYVFVKPASSSYGGNLVVGTSEVGSYNDIVVAVGAFHGNAEVVRFHGNSSNSGTIVVKLPTNNTLTANTGALQVWGGASVSGNVYHGAATVFNGSQGAGNDFYVRGKNDSTLIWARPSATYDAVILGNSAVQANVVTGAKLQVFTTDSILLPAGTSAQRPGSAGGTDTVGMFRYNTTLNAIEYYGGATPGWNLVSSQFTVISVDTFNGDGSTVAFTMGGSATTAGIIASINGVVQQPTAAYSVSGSTLTFTEAPASGDVIDVRRLTTTQTVTGIASVNGYMQMQVDNDGAYIYTGSSSTSATTYWDTAGAKVGALANVSVSSANTATTIDTMSTGTYRSAKYVVQVTNGANYQVMEALMISNGTTATVTTYGTIQTNGNLGVLSATQSGGNALLQFIATNSTNNVRITKDYLLI